MHNIICQAIVSDKYNNYPGKDEDGKKYRSKDVNTTSNLPHLVFLLHFLKTKSKFEEHCDFEIGDSEDPVLRHVEKVPQAIHRPY